MDKRAVLSISGLLVAVFLAAGTADTSGSPKRSRTNPRQPRADADAAARTSSVTPPREEANEWVTANARPATKAQLSTIKDGHRPGEVFRFWNSGWTVSVPGNDEGHVYVAIQLVGGGLEDESPDVWSLGGPADQPTGCFSVTSSAKLWTVYPWSQWDPDTDRWLPTRACEVSPKDATVKALTDYTRQKFLDELAASATESDER